MADEDPKPDEGKTDEGPKYDLAAINEERKKLGRPELDEQWASHAAANAGSQDLTWYLTNYTQPAQIHSKEDKTEGTVFHTADAQQQDDSSDDDSEQER